MSKCHHHIITYIVAQWKIVWIVLINDLGELSILNVRPTEMSRLKKGVFNKKLWCLSCQGGQCYFNIKWIHLSATHASSISMTAYQPNRHCPWCSGCCCAHAVDLNHQGENDLKSWNRSHPCIYGSMKPRFPLHAVSFLCLWFPMLLQWCYGTCTSSRGS